METHNLHPSIHVDLKCSPNQHVQLDAGLTRINQNRHQVVAKLIGLADLNIDVSADATYHSIDNLGVIIKIDAPKAKLNKAHLEVHIKPKDSTEHGVQVKASNDGKNILSGNAHYNIEEKAGKTEVSGRGDVKWYDETQTASFNLVRNNVEDGETGYTVSS